MRKLLFYLIMFSIIILYGFNAYSAATPVGVSIIPPLQFPPSDYSVTGARASVLYGSHREVYGLDLGLIGNVTEKRFAGLSIAGIFNYTAGKTTAVGMQFAGITNINKMKSYITGLQFATIANYNRAEATISGLQFALLNLSTHSTIYGFQAGLYNRAWTVYGIQIGLINVCNNLRGFQIGLLNFNKAGIFPVSPLVNFGF